MLLASLVVPPAVNSRPLLPQSPDPALSQPRGPPSQDACRHPPDHPCLMLHSVTFTCACSVSRMGEKIPGKPGPLRLCTFSHACLAQRWEDRGSLIISGPRKASCPVVSVVLGPHSAWESPEEPPVCRPSGPTPETRVPLLWKYHLRVLA